MVAYFLENGKYEQPDYLDGGRYRRLTLHSKADTMTPSSDIIRQCQFRYIPKKTGNNQ